MLTLRPETPTQALDLAFRRQKPTRAQLDAFAEAQAQLLAAINPHESEEHLKTHLRDFLGHGGVLGPGHYVNVSQRRDMVVRLGPTEASPVGLLIEAKKPANPGEMVSTTDLNRKAMHELLLYYLQDRHAGVVDNLRRLVITNGYEWFVFDALDFDRLFWRNTGLKNDFLDWAAGKKAGSTTAFFYHEIARPFLAALAGELAFAYLDLRVPTSAERDLLTRAKLFQAPHLLKAPFAQDANTLNRAFYEELLYLIGLEEVPDKGRKLIKRVAPAEREHAGSLLRNTIEVLESEDRLADLPSTERAAYGATPEAQLFGVALELCLTWVNRLLFLKLLEGQLRRYHAGNPDALTEPFRFLTPALLPDFDTLNDLFFKVLNKPADQRTADIKKRYGHLPYLNSSLYEPTELERRTLTVRELNDQLTLPYHSRSVLPHPHLSGGRRRGRSVLPVNLVHGEDTPAPTTTKPATTYNNQNSSTLSYLLRFLDAYDFASEGDEQVQETHKPLISAAVLGLIFEKLNGYQDGSFYTPGFITMYMARHTLRRAVVQHFERRYGLGAANVPALAEALAPQNRVADSAYFNTLTVLDPAVGSGHFLVSALNELLAIKAELGLLLDESGKRLRYRLTVARDELVVMHEDDDPHDPAALFQYRARLDAATGQRTVAPAHTALQRALFQEKRHLIEHALFGVDINPNSVRICRLRLWIELLKHAYYLPDTGFAQLETLPNLELNIKAGNSLLSRFDLAADLSDVFRQSKFTLATYRDAVHAYFNTRDRAAKQDLQKFLTQIKEQFTQALHKRDPLREKLRRALGERTVLETQGQLLPETPKQREARTFELRRLTLLIEQYEKEVERHEQGQLYRHAFEWRFEFPEVLDEKGKFRGFDVVIGNPPYIRADEQPLAQRRAILASKRFVTLSEKWDLYVAFLELGHILLKQDGLMSMIVSDAYNHAKYAKSSQKWFLENAVIERLDFFKGFMIFEEANVGSIIPFIEKHKPSAKSIPTRRLHLDRFDNITLLATKPQTQSDHRIFFPSIEESTSEISGTLLSEICYVSKGMVVHAHEGASVGAFGLDDLVSDTEDEIHSIPFSEGKNLERWLPAQNRWLEWGTARAPALFSRPTFNQLYQVPEKLIASDISSAANALKVSYDDQQLFHNHSAWSFVPWHSLRGVQNRSLQKAARYRNEKPREDLPKREELEEISEQYSVKYLLAVMNSSTAREFLTKIRRSNIHLYPDDWKQLPIPHATPAQQAEIAALVEQVLAAKTAGEPTATLEAAIDALVAARYGLSPAEVAQLGG